MLPKALESIRLSVFVTARWVNGGAQDPGTQNVHDLEDRKLFVSHLFNLQIIFLSIVYTSGQGAHHLVLHWSPTNHALGSPWDDS